jgi:hypothetical protein
LKDALARQKRVEQLREEMSTAAGAAAAAKASLQAAKVAAGEHPALGLFCVPAIKVIYCCQKGRGGFQGKSASQT